jgi:hypothetical protein
VKGAELVGNFARQWIGMGLLRLSLLPGLLGNFVLVGYDAAPRQTPTAATNTASQALSVYAKNEEAKMWMTVAERRFAISLANNPAAQAFSEQLPLVLDMADLNKNEKYAELPKALPANATRVGTIRNGDLMLYGSTTLVVFYLAFETSYSYTPLGRVDDPAGLAKALGQSGVRISFLRS